MVRPHAGGPTWTSSRNLSSLTVRRGETSPQTRGTAIFRAEDPWIRGEDHTRGLRRSSGTFSRLDVGPGPERVATAHSPRLRAVSRRVNDNGVHIADAAAMNRAGQLRDGGNDFFEVATWTAGKDDLILRGNGIVDVPAKYFLFYERNRPRQGDSPWEFYGNVRWASEGLETPARSSLQIDLEPTYHVNDRLRFFTTWFFERNSDWILWRGDNLLGSYNEDMILLNAGSVFLISDKQELRVRLEAIGLDAKARKAWRVEANGEPVESAEGIPNVGLRNLGFQIRYRYELAPLSYLYVVYGRGGRDNNRFGDSAGALLGDAFGLRDDEQLLVKLSYRFEL